MKFNVYGPFTLKLSKRTNLITKESMASLISDVEAVEEGLSEACGCYVFCVQARGIVPWYVGQANKSALVTEALNASNREKYNEVMFKRDGKMAMSKRHGTPMLFLLPKLTPSGKSFAKSANSSNGIKSIDFLEEWLIANSLQKNPEMKNNKKTYLLRNIHVKGIFNANQGEATNPSTKLKNALGL